MTNEWDDWPPDDLPDADTADLGLGEDPGQPDFAADPGFDHLDDAGPDEPGVDEPDAGDPAPDAADQPPPLGYGDEPLAGDAGPGDAGPGDGEGPQPVGPGTVEGADPPVGADPDLVVDDPAGEPVFPTPLDLASPPDPVDGFPWADAGLLGDADGALAEPLPDPLAGAHGAPPPEELYAYSGEQPPGGRAGWAGLIGSADPATSTLARFWSTG